MTVKEWRLSQRMPADYRVMLSALARVRRVKLSAIIVQALDTMILGDAEFGPFKAQLARDPEFTAAYQRTVAPIGGRDAIAAVAGATDTTERAPAMGPAQRG